VLEKIQRRQLVIADEWSRGNGDGLGLLGFRPGKPGNRDGRFGLRLAGFFGCGLFTDRGCGCGLVVAFGIDLFCFRGFRRCGGFAAQNFVRRGCGQFTGADDALRQRVRVL
jgi:hypothetical protein